MGAGGPGEFAEVLAGRRRIGDGPSTSTAGTSAPLVHSNLERFCLQLLCGARLNLRRCCHDRAFMCFSWPSAMPCDMLYIAHVSPWHVGSSCGCSVRASLKFVMLTLPHGTWHPLKARSFHLCLLHVLVIALVHTLRWIYQVAPTACH